MKKLLTIAGSDCSGGAGIQADLKTFAAHGVFGMSVITSVVAENTVRVIDALDLPAEIIEKQIDAVFEDIEPDAVKIGMLPTPPIMISVVEKLRQYGARNVVIDPVMFAKNGCPLMREDCAKFLIEAVLPSASLLTPNIPEAEIISGIDIKSEEDMRRAAIKICKSGCRAALIKGGHRVGDALDILFDGKEFHRFESERIDTKNTHGTGCTLSSAIASNLALGHALPKAVARAKSYVTAAIRHSLALGKGNGPTNHFYELYKRGGIVDYEA